MWALNQRRSQLLKAAQTELLRKLLGFAKLDHQSNSDCNFEVQYETYEAQETWRRRACREMDFQN